MSRIQLLVLHVHIHASGFLMNYLSCFILHFVVEVSLTKRRTENSLLFVLILIYFQKKKMVNHGWDISLAHLHKCVGQIITSYQWLWAGGHFLFNCVNWELSVHAKNYHWYFTTKWSVSWKVNHSSSGINHGFVYYCGKPLGEQFQKVNFWKQLSTFLSSVSSLCLQSPIMNVLLSECVFWVHRGFFWQNGEGKSLSIQYCTCS